MANPWVSKNWLNDDYVKFVRFAQWRIEKTGGGVLAFVTNHGYLENPTFRGMRQSLVQTFTDIYLIDLHGNSLKKEKTPEGDKDDNVFDIQQGVAIGLFVKELGKTGPARVHHTDLWGSREGKYEWLASEDVEKTEWTELTPSSPSYLFASRDLDLLAEYEQGWTLTDIMSVNTSGIITARDHLVVDFDDEAIGARMRVFRDTDRVSDDEAKVRLGLSENYAWRIATARREFLRLDDWEQCLTSIVYRPFNLRRIVYHPSVVWRTRAQVMHHMLTNENLGLITTRQTRDDWDAHVTQSIVGHKSLAAYDINYIFPFTSTPQTTTS